MSVLIKHKPVISEGKLVTLKYHLYPKLQFSGCQSNRESFSSWTWEGLHVLLFIWVSLFSRLESYIVENGLIFPQIEVWFMWDQRSRCLRMGTCLLQGELLCCQFFFFFAFTVLNSFDSLILHLGSSLWGLVWVLFCSFVVCLLFGFIYLLITKWNLQHYVFDIQCFSLI